MIFEPSTVNSPGCDGAIPEVPLLAFTATATARVRTDIIAQLELRDPAVHVASFKPAKSFLSGTPQGQDLVP